MPSVHPPLTPWGTSNARIAEGSPAAQRLQSATTAMQQWPEPPKASEQYHRRNNPNAEDNRFKDVCLKNDELEGKSKRVKNSTKTSIKTKRSQNTRDRIMSNRSSLQALAPWGFTTAVMRRLTTKEVDVVIVGCNLSGLIAARELHKKDNAFTFLRASNNRWTRDPPNDQNRCRH